MEIGIHYVDLEVLAERGVVPLSLASETVCELIEDGCYRKVAILRVDGLSEAFRITQNGIDSVESWAFDHPAEIVSLLVPIRAARKVKPGLRSSMVGDVFTANGVAYLVDDVGFRELGPSSSLFPAKAA
jgi:hypothetical protein